MDDGVEPAAEGIQLPRVLAALAGPHPLRQAGLDHRFPGPTDSVICAGAEPVA